MTNHPPNLQRMVLTGARVRRPHGGVGRARGASIRQHHITQIMKIIPLLVLCCCGFLLTGCASSSCENFNSTSAMKTSSPVSFYESEMFSTDAKARLKTIQDDYHLKGIWVRDHDITVSTGVVSKAQADAIEKAIHDVVGNDFGVDLFLGSFSDVNEANRAMAP